ncbi:hypothetical protein GH733_001401 [Mirounga leonina]|nr:hypothetical protein GH733_001401 [Mirounga leonina]
MLHLPVSEVYLLEKAPGFGLENPTAKIEPSSWSGSESPAENMERMSDSADKPIDNDAEGVWSPDIEQSFQEALAIYPPCGRRKIILSDEGKMYGLWNANPGLLVYTAQAFALTSSSIMDAGPSDSGFAHPWRNISLEKNIKLLWGFVLWITLFRVNCGSSGARIEGNPSCFLSFFKENSGYFEKSSPYCRQCGGKVESKGTFVVRRKGRNELIARYIKLRTGKTRTRKQVSSHIQVLARRKSRDFHSKLKFWPGMIQTGQPGSSQDVKPFVQQAYPIQPAVTAPIPGFEPASAPAPSVPAWQGRSIGTTKLRLVEFSAFLEQQRDPDSITHDNRTGSTGFGLLLMNGKYNKHLFVHIGHANHSYSDPLLESVDIRQIYDKFPEKKGGLKELFGKGPQNAFFLVKFWADLNCSIQDDAGAFYGVTSQYESSENMTVTCSTKVCSFGKQVVEKVETEYARFENGRFVYRINRSPMCEYMINFIHKLKHLPEKYMMNSVLENFTILLDE